MKRLTRRRVSLVVLLLLAAAGPGCDQGAKTRDVVAAGLRADERPCPGFAEQVRRFSTMSNAALVKSGAADGLSVLGETTQAHASRSLALAQSAYPSAAVRIGPGVGVTYSIASDRTITYHHGADYQFWLRFPSLQACPAMPGSIDGIPFFAVFKKPQS